jgi:hypothetical protein
VTQPWSCKIELTDLLLSYYAGAVGLNCDDSRSVNLEAETRWRESIARTAECSER